MRALSVIVVVVVLIFTTGSLAAATSSSFTPQPHNLICTHPGNNTTCSQEKIISATQIPLPTPSPIPQPSATLTIIKDVINDIVGTIFTKHFTSSASDSNVSPQSSFPGAQSPGTAVTSKPGTFPVVLLQQVNSTTTGATAVADHNKRSGDIITCIYNKETHHSAKDTIPFVLPIPFP